MRKRYRRRQRRGTVHGQRVSSSLQGRLEQVGPAKFGILAVDSSKKRFAVLLSDFLGRELTGLMEFENTAAGLAALVATAKALCEEHGLKDLVAAIERSGRYHVPAREALQRHWTIRMVHPFATKQLRQPAAPGTKTDLTDLRAIIRAIMVGYGTQERELPERWQQWRLLSREREDRVRKRAKVRVQVQERLQALMPGYSALFGDLWKSPIALALAGHYGSAAALRADGHEAILEWLRQANHAARRETVARVLQWASLAAPPDPCPEFRHRLLCDQFHLAQALDAQIALYEADLAHYLVDTPLVLLLAIPGINVVSAASYGAELGPIQHYPDPKKIAGRAGLYPSRYQSDEVDRPDGPLVGRRNARLRDAILEIAHNLIRCNEHFKAWAHIRRNKRWPATKIHVAVGTKFTRISYWMLAGRMVFQHPSMCGGDAVLAKLTDFATRAGLEPRGIRDLLLRASRQLPKLALEGEARALVERLPRRRSRRRPQTDQSLQPVLLGDVLREVIRDLAPGVAIEAERSQRSQRNARRAPH